MTNDIKPIKIRLDASTLCQLECPLCPRDALEENIGFGFLKFDDFKNVLDSNPWVSEIELSNYGEIFLNPDLQAGLSECLNNEKINYARAMLLGCKESRQDIPCSTCKYYKLKRKNGTWVSLADVEDSRKKASFDYI